MDEASDRDALRLSSVTSACTPDRGVDDLERGHCTEIGHLGALRKMFNQMWLLGWKPRVRWGMSSVSSGGVGRLLTREQPGDRVPFTPLDGILLDVGDGPG